MDPKRLRDIPLFAGLSKEDLEQLGRWTDEIEVPEGKRLAEEGNFAHEFFVVEEGTADVTQDGNTIATLTAGDFFGEIGLVATERRTASVVATSPMRLVVMSGRDFRAMQDKLPHIADEVRQTIIERLARDRGD
jgi:CRP/FNR family transcriptional regulator, cyclic AMP receptor protein